MAGKTDVFENDILKLIFNGTAIANFADNAASSPATTLYLSLHTADPTDAAPNGQSTYEVTAGVVPNYARVAIVRTSGGWVVSGGSVSPVNPVDFPTAGAGMSGTVTATYAGIGTALTGNGKLLYTGAINPAIIIAAGVTPRFTTASTITED